MSGLNHKGPMNEGPMTGRKMGKCTNFGKNLNTSTDSNMPETASNAGGNNLTCKQHRGNGNGMRNVNGNGSGMGKRFRRSFGQSEN